MNKLIKVLHKIVKFQMMISDTSLGNFVHSLVYIGFGLVGGLMDIGFAAALYMFPLTYLEFLLLIKLDGGLLLMDGGGGDLPDLPKIIGDTNKAWGKVPKGNKWAAGFGAACVVCVSYAKYRTVTKQADIEVEKTKQLVCI
jgi:hypothetical protein